MRYQGRITTWKDDRGYGFITPNGGGDQVFVHISAFSNARRRPAGNELVTYETVVEGKRRIRAAKVAFVAAQSAAAKSSGFSQVRTIIAASFMLLLLAMVIGRKFAPAVLALYVGASIVALLLYGRDKSAARASRWRTEENTLHMISLFGGWPGALVAQQIFRHKTNKAEFQFGFWVTVVVNCAGLLALALYL
jgi:uncharacterized membrane protein YsdA (DUF1294 family)/cold shock CspA family protein